MPQVNLEVVYLGPDPANSQIIDAWVETGGVRATEVPVGSEFKIFVKAKAANTSGFAWKVLVTAYCQERSELSRYDYIRAAAGTFTTTYRYFNHIPDTASTSYPVMPDVSQLSYRIKLWGNNDPNAPNPALAEWA